MKAEYYIVREMDEEFLLARWIVRSHILGEEHSIHHGSYLSMLEAQKRLLELRSIRNEQ